MTNNTATATCINKKEWRYAFSHQRVQPFLVIEASRLRRPLMAMGWLEEIFLFSVTLSRVGDSFKAIQYILFLFETLNRVGWLLYCSICAAQLFRLLRTKCRFIKQVSHSSTASPPESLRHISPLLCCHSWTFTRWCSSLAGLGCPKPKRGRHSTPS